MGGLVLVKELIIAGVGALAFISTSTMLFLADIMGNVTPEDIDLLKDTVLEQFQENLEETPLNHTYTIPTSDIENSLNDAIDQTIESQFTDITQEEQEEAINALNDLITSKDTQLIINEVEDHRQDMLEYQKNSLRWHGLFESDFY